MWCKWDSTIHYKRKVLFTFIWWIFKSYIAATEINNLMDVILVIEEKLSKKINISFLFKIFCNKFCFKFIYCAIRFKLFLRTHLQPIVLQPGGNSTKFHVLLEISESISSFTTSFQNITSGDNKATCKVRGFSSTLKT